MIARVKAAPLHLEVAKLAPVRRSSPFQGVDSLAADLPYVVLDEKGRIEVRPSLEQAIATKAPLPGVRRLLDFVTTEASVPGFKWSSAPMLPWPNSRHNQQLVSAAIAGDRGLMAKLLAQPLAERVGGGPSTVLSRDGRVDVWASITKRINAQDPNSPLWTDTQRGLDEFGFFLLEALNSTTPTREVMPFAKTVENEALLLAIRSPQFKVLQGLVKEHARRESTKGAPLPVRDPQGRLDVRATLEAWVASGTPNGLRRFGRSVTAIFNTGGYDLVPFPLNPKNLALLDAASRGDLPEVGRLLKQP